MKILLLEDEKMLRESIKEYLEGMNHFVDECGDGFEAKKKILKEEYELLLLDINVPKIDGFALISSIKEQNIATPVIFISALTGIEDITQGFSLGCLDYIKKPFHLKELVLRIENTIKRDTKIKTMKISSKYCFDFATNTLYFDDKPEIITKKQLQIIRLLSNNIGIVVDFERFRESVWNNELIDNATIRAEVNRLKKSLKEDFIKNCRGIGYMIAKPA